MNNSIKCILTFFILIFFVESTEAQISLGKVSLYPEYQLDAEIFMQPIDSKQEAGKN